MIAAHALRTPSRRNVASVASTAVAPTSGAASIPTLAPEEPSLAEPGPSAPESASELVTPPSGSLDHEHARGAGAAAVHVSPQPLAPAISAQTSRPPVPPVAVPAPPPSVAPPLGNPIDKSATF